MDEFGQRGRDFSRARYAPALKSAALATLRDKKIVDTTPDDFRAALADNKPSTNHFLRRIHNLAVGTGWLPWPIIPIKMWPAIQLKRKRGVTVEEHRLIIASEANVERRHFYELLWEVAAQMRRFQQDSFPQAASVDIEFRPPPVTMPGDWPLLTELHVTLGVAHRTVANLTTLITDLKKARLNCTNAQLGKRGAYVALRAARTTADAFIQRARDYLVGIFGSDWNQGWSVVGFANQSLALPDTDAHRFTVLQLVRDYFTANDEKEALQLNVTAAEATVQLAALTTEKTTAEACRFDQRSKRDLRDTAELGLEKHLRSLWNELGSILDALDARWLKFIDRIPGDPRVPEAVQDVAAAAQPGGIITLDWQDATRAARYKGLSSRWWAWMRSRCWR